MILCDSMLIKSQGKKELSFVAATTGTSSTTFSFTSLSFGTPHTTREIFVSISFWNAASRSVSSASIGGVSATVLYTLYARNCGVALIRASVPTGATGTVSITMNGSTNNCSIAVYRVVNRGAAFETGLYSTAQNDALATTSAALSGLNVTANGFVLSVITINNTASNVNFSGIGIAAWNRMSPTSSHFSS